MAVDAKECWLDIYAEKIITGLVQQKAKFDACINWLLTINVTIFGAITAGLFFNKDGFDNYIFILSIGSIGFIWTWMIMLRSCLAYRELINFNRILHFIHIYTQNPTVEAKELFFKQIEQLDFTMKNKDSDRVFVLSKISTFRKHLTMEYGIVLIIYLLFMLYSWYLHIGKLVAKGQNSESYAFFFKIIQKTEIHTNPLISLVVFIIILCLITYRTIFYKKETKYIEINN